ncbi:restriction endonuclease subunit S [Faecalibacterium prausnitzii]|uniref:restriction endonuclease subunit S n=1 Tax=Faecalibacterium prausnitzii TaxID=853 RepID=UPI0012DBFA4D|nr:restriction endonuclease subunit S [Faecalibacterium prausnitzii]
MARKMKDSGIEWIGEIPEGWEVVPIKRLCTMQAGKNLTSEQIAPEGTYPVYGGNGIRGFFSDYNCDGQFLTVGRQGALCGNVHKINGKIWATEHAVITTPSSYTILDFLYYLLIGMDLNQYVSSTAAQPGLAVGTLLNLKTCYPCSTLEQTQISNYLNAKCTEIDTMLSKTRASIEEYKKLKQAVITQAVTKGVRGEREMMDSELEWIGEIPAEWSVQRIKTIFSIRNERNFLPLEQVNLISLYTDKGVIQHCDIEKTTGNKASNADGYKKVYPNDMIVNIILCWMGAIGRSDYAGVTSPAYDVYVPSSKIECKFYHYYFRTLGFSGDCYKNGRGIMAMRWRTYSDQFRSIKVVVPPLEEQKEIVGYLDARCAEIDKLIAKKEQLVKELESYKKSLIYEVVTGKREV